MAEDPEELVVLCNLVEHGPSGVYGSTRERCSGCNKEVWLSPATRETVERASRESGQPYKFLCLLCGERRLHENPSKDDKLMPPSPEQLREIVKGLIEQDDELMPPSPEQLREIVKGFIERN